MKARLLAVLSISTLVLASAAPAALAQVTSSGDNNNSVQYVDCSQVQNAVQAQYGDQNASANDSSTAEIANKLNISQSQVNACLGSIGNDGESNDNGNEDEDQDRVGNGDEDETVVQAEDLKDGEDAVLAGTDPGGTLPETGGPSLLALGAGLALVAGGALIRSRR